MLLRDYLQTTHGISRRNITALIDQGAILLNNEKVENYKAEIKEKDVIEIKSLSIKEVFKTQNNSNYPILLAFNKPKGYTCSKSDPHNKTFYELLPKDFQKKYYYIGRLDKDSHGLMLLTSNPKLVHEFEHPSKEIEKTYLIELNKPFNWNLKEKILKGIHEGGEFLRTRELKKTKDGKIEITLNEGKKRHIRRIFKSLGYEVTDLQRISIGNYLLGNLKLGEYQEVNYKPQNQQ